MTAAVILKLPHPFLARCGIYKGTKLNDHRRAENLKHVRDMCQNPTPTEAQLWGLRRGKQVERLKFRRQHPIGANIVELYCHELELAIEVDGESHAF